ncbi:MAG TPA: PP0621 family protein [Aquabacterium sp.]|uniref:PP0621 family protein n=1 Tax=Aquabacterium sp. TaxID=1872578 RepID=UPI002E358451|nr:PP0621 family protein [Aquabacterium sp.]HEX5356584.1 PP0621 family protein [Aquabacterium sp.]
MLKYLLLAVVIIWLFYSPALRGKLQGGKPPKAPAPNPTPTKAESMVQCANCGVHLPEGEALKDGHGQPYCSAAHRQAGPGRA